ncbi:hypothetical protein BDF22DRAFT_681099, partial [Syncephalis plumigaleata]
MGASQLSGNCFIYRYIEGHELWKHLLGKNYAEQLDIINQVMPQLLQAFIYLYNAGIIHQDLSLANIMVKQEDSGQLSAVVFDFDKIGILPSGRKKLDIAIMPISPIRGLNPYMCNNFNLLPSNFIRRAIPNALGQVTPEIPSKLDDYIKSIVASEGASFNPLTKEALISGRAAYISLLKVNRI